MAATSRRGKTIHFLIAYDHDKRKRVRWQEFTNGSRAVEAYFAMETEFEDQPRVEVVLLGGDSERAIRVTHPNYFNDRVIEELLQTAG
ncbi:hypothetical protein [Candidatus Poriferisodalis sp.]|uniref:hypothetical protein n=1 Tax=Candidatus Poriferisodalis sp. TaxID=3101277 RepID=UPI003B01D16B